jgi:hypothetical protein
MAFLACTRSGYQPLDELIERYELETIDLQGSFVLEDGSEVQTPKTIVQARELVDPALAFGQCVIVSMNFSAWLRTEILADDKLQDETWAPHRFGLVMTPHHGPDWFGYIDRPVAGVDRHTAVIVSTPVGTFAIDWTAAQYGYDAAPLVQLRDELHWEADLTKSPRWLRTWAGDGSGVAVAEPVS